MSLVDEEVQEKLKLRRKYLAAVVIVLAILALPTSRFQNIYRMSVWTVIILGTLVPYVWPFLIDGTAWFVVTSMSLVHFLVMALLYSLLPRDDYILMGVAIVSEILLFSIPVGWLQVRSRRKRSLRPASGSRP